ncbi:MAG: DUF2849 domain-containing protein [Rhodospirillaceae bacterium]|jgi:hypothetical protein
MPRPEGDLFAITANDLRNGLVVYLSEAGDWTETLADARLVAAAGVEAALGDAGHAAAAGRIVGAYEIAVERSGEGVRPLRLRERIRAFGPSTHADFRRADVAGHLDHADGVVAVSFGR